MLRLRILEKEAREAEVDSKTTRMLAINAALDEELTVDMAEFANMRERIIEMRKKNKAFHKNMIVKLQKMRGRYSVREQEANSSTDDAHPRATREDSNEEIVYKDPIMGHLKGRNQWITLPAYELTHRAGARVVSCALVYKHLKWKPRKGISSDFEHENSSKEYAFNPNQRRHTIEECVQLKARIRRQIKLGNIPHIWGYNTVLTYDQPNPVENIRFICHYSTPFRMSVLQIYNLVQSGVLASIHEDDRGLYPVREEILKPCAYHDATDHSLSRCLSFLYNVEALVNMGKTRVEFIPRG